MDRPKLWTRDYTLGLAAMHLYFISFFGLLAALPLYLDDWNDAAIGLNVGAMAFAAMAARPVAGVVIDRSGRRRSMLWGAAFTALAVGALIITDNPYLLLPARVLHGVAMAFFTTAVLALVTDLAPAERRGEAAGYFGAVNSGAQVYAPFLGVAIAEGIGFGTLFVVLAISAAAALALTLVVREPPRHDTRAGDEPSRYVSRTALMPATVFLGLTVAFGAVQAFAALFADDNDLGNAGLFFALFGAALTATRFSVGPLTDRFGRGAVIVPGIVIGSVGMFVLAIPSPVAFFGAAALLGVGLAAGHTGLLAQTMDRAGPAERGAAVATFTMSWDVGAVVGASALGLLAEAAGYAEVFVVTGVFGLAMAATYPAAFRRPARAVAA